MCSRRSEESTVAGVEGVVGTEVKGAMEPMILGTL